LSVQSQGHGSKKTGYMSIFYTVVDMMPEIGLLYMWNGGARVRMWNF